MYTFELSHNYISQSLSVHFCIGFTHIIFLILKQPYDIVAISFQFRAEETEAQSFILFETFEKEKSNLVVLKFSY